MIGFQWIILLTNGGAVCITHLFHHPSILYGVILSPDVRSFLFLEYEFCLHAWTLVQACCGVVSTKISKLTAMPLVPVSLAFQHNSPPRQKKQGYERFTFLQHCKKTGRTNHWTHFFTNRMGCSLMTIEKMKGNGRETGFYKMVPFLGNKVQACKPKTYSGKKNRTSGLSIPRTKWRGDEKRWLMHTVPPVCKEIKSLEPNHSVGFS